ncbi:type 1 glutamine amidotransferase [Maritalea porphyrae]|uniref:type 1 glutamine amidotransferase n=1 Tax=Maritalea porphyrae TaxID=880732 RepID=UPI0022AFA010|nr:type 1 glutamine amidotransferase [Maritalea porphyrae]MCZ4271698.1 type 1 glutamine amidotransferase [Maritalea porphyrae]
MKVSVFQTGLVAEPLRGRFDNYGKMFADLVGDGGGKFTYETVSLIEDEPLPNIDDVEAIIITGSSLGVYDKKPWMDPLRDFIREAYARSIPMIGVCFGHQILADALGGVVKKSEKGWGVGRHQYAITQKSAYMADAPDQMQFNVIHQDQVITPPSISKVIGGNDFTPNAMLEYDNGAAISIQAHPEFENEYAKAVYTLRSGELFDPKVGEEAVASAQTQNDNELMAEYFRRFLNRSD